MTAPNAASGDEAAREMAMRTMAILERRGIPTGGVSTCPLCGIIWVVTEVADCFMPACGCYGENATASNPDRPCEPCGLNHAFGCTKLIGSSDQKT